MVLRTASATGRAFQIIPAFQEEQAPPQNAQQ
jgi:hypothetical protein